MSWSVKVLEVARPSLNEVRIRYMLQKDEADFVGSEVVLSATDLAGLTANQKQQKVLEAIRANALPYVQTDSHISDVKPLEGRTFDPSK